MFPNSPYAHSVGSFQFPVAVPGQDPDTGEQVGVFFNKKWLPYIVGSLYQLLLQSTWAVSDDNQLAIVQGQAFDLINLFALASSFVPAVGSAGADSEDIMIRQNPTNACELQTSIDGVNWCTFADFSKCQNFGSQPGGGSSQPQPGGGTVNNCATLQANGRLLLQAPVSTGDTITITAANGSGNDGVEIPWRCPDGAEFFAGTCDEDLKTTDGADPVPAAKHMQTIVLIGGTAYQIDPHITFTVPMGISNAYAELAINQHTPSTTTGSYTICYTQTNNKVATWTHHFDFTMSSGGWVLDPGVGACPGQYTPGVGWELLYGNCVGSPNGYLTFLKYFAANITSLRAVYTVSGVNLPPGDFDDGFVSLGTLNGNVGSYDAIFPGAHTITNHVRFEFTTTTAGSSCVVTDIYISGTGIDPF